MSLAKPSRRLWRRFVPRLEFLEARTVPSAMWTAQGPAPTLQGQPYGMDPQGNPQVGAINSFAPSPTNPDLLYVAAASGGIWRTTDATDANPQWTPLTDNQPTLSIGDIAFSPVDANTLYVGTGSYTNGNFGEYGMPNGGPALGVLKSTDGGNTWTLLGQSTFANTNQRIRQIVPTSLSGGQVILAGTRGPNASPGGVYRSADGGNTWTRISGTTGTNLPDGDVTTLIDDPDQPSTLYTAVIAGSAPGVYRSTDGGQTWSLDNGTGPTATTTTAGSLPAATLTAADNLKLALHPGAPGTLYLLTGSTPTPHMPGVSSLFFSTDHGTTWKEMDNVPLINSDGQTGSNLAVAADPTSATVVFVTGSAAPSGTGLSSVSIVYRGDTSAPLGQQWAVATGPGAAGVPPGGTTSQPTASHSDARTMLFDANGNLLLSNDGGIYRLMYPDAVASQRFWVAVTGNLQVAELYGVAYDSIDHITVGAPQDSGMTVQPGRGQQAWNSFFGSDETHVAVDNSGQISSSAILYGIGNGFDDFRRVAFTTQARPTNTRMKLASSPGGALLSGLNATDQMATSASYIPFALDAQDPHRLMIGFNGLYESSNQGDTVTDITPTGISDLVTAIVFGGGTGATANANVAYVGTKSGQLFVGTTAGNTFTLSKTFQLAVRSIALDPFDPATAYVVTGSNSSSEVWVSTNTGGTWTKITGNLGTLGTHFRTVAVYQTSASATPVVLVGGLGTGTSGVFRTNGALNGSSTSWEVLGCGLPNVQVQQLVVNTADDILVAATFGRGAWTLSPLSQALTATSDLAVTVSASTGASPGTTLTYTITLASRGPLDAQTVSLSFPLPTGTTFAAETHLPGFTATTPAVGAGGTVKETIATLLCGTTATFTVVVNVGSSAVLGTSLHATITATSSTSEGTPADNTATATTSVQSDDALFVSGLYHDILGRGGDPVGLSGFTQIVDNARFAALSQIATSFVTSAEHRSDVISFYYTHYLGRKPAPSELSGWLTALTNGLTQEQVLADIVSSPEYFSKAGGTNQDWVNHVYPDVLGRPADPSTSTIVDDLNNGTLTLNQVALLLVGSTEFRTNLIAMTYTTYLGRSPGTNEINGWLPILGETPAGAGQPSPHEVFLSSILASPEFFLKNGSTASLWLTAVYNDLLKRAPDTAGFNATLLALLGDYTSTRQTIALSLATSTEANDDRIAAFYQKYLGRPASPTELSGWVSALGQGFTLEQIRVAILSSPEFFGKEASTNSLWLDQVYKDVLGRSRAPGDTALLNALNAGTMTLAQVATTLVTGLEYREDLAQADYLAYLGRPGATSELNGWAMLLAGGLTDQQMAASFASSDEYMLHNHLYP
jgi:uncharacterized repeat protein (TIGR01451 family)